MTLFACCDMLMVPEMVAVASVFLVSIHFAANTQFTP